MNNTFLMVYREITLSYMVAALLHRGKIQDSDGAGDYWTKLSLKNKCDTGRLRLRF